MTTRQRRLNWLAVLASCALCGCVGGCGPGGGGTEPAHGRQEVALPRLAAAFTILRSKSVPPTRLMRSRMKEGRWVALSAHEAETSEGPIWLATSHSGQICLFAGAPPASSCAPGSFALRHGLTLGVVTAPADPSRRRFGLYGVIPDGKDSVRIRIGEHTVRTIPVRRGAFSFGAREPVVKL